MLMQISAKMDAIILFVTDTVMLVRLNGTLISLRSSDLKRGHSTERSAALIFLIKCRFVPRAGRPNQLSVFGAIRTTPTRVLLWSCLLPVLPKSGPSATGSVGSQVRSYTSSVW